MFHSLEICFCFSLLLRVIILEDELEKLVCTKETQELVSEAYQILEQKLKLIQPHVQASNNCWEEAISQVDKLLRRNTDKKGTYESSFACTLQTSLLRSRALSHLLLVSMIKLT